MRSTGEVLGLAETFPLAFYKSQEAAQGKRILKALKINTKQSIVFKNLKKH